MKTNVLFSFRSFKKQCAVIASFCLAASARSQSFTAIDLGTLGGSESFGLGINDSGTVVGYSETPGNVAQNAFSFGNGTMSDLGAPNGGGSVALAINSQGAIAGYFTNSAGVLDAFGYSNGSFTDLGNLSGNSTLNGEASAARAINGAGTVVGESNTTGNVAPVAFLYTNGQMTPISGLGSFSSVATGINVSGTIVGFNQSNGQAFSFHNNSVTYLGTLGGSFSAAWAINNVGIIVGDSATQTGVQDAFIYDNGTMTDLNTLVNLPGVTLTTALAVNDLGQIVAEGSNDQSYLLTAIPEPSSYAAILGAAALGLEVMRRKTRVKS